MLRLAATAAGIPALTFEVGAPARLQVSEIEVAVAAIIGLMHHLAMIQGDPGDPVAQPIFMIRSGCAPTRSEEHTSELQSLMRLSYAGFCLKKKTKHKMNVTRSYACT